MCSSACFQHRIASPSFPCKRPKSASRCPDGGAGGPGPGASIPGSHSRRRWNTSGSSHRMSSATQRGPSRSCYRTWRRLMMPVDMPSCSFGLIGDQPRRRNQHSRVPRWINRAVFKTNVQAGTIAEHEGQVAWVGCCSRRRGELGPPGGVDGLQPSLSVGGTGRNSACINSWDQVTNQCWGAVNAGL